MTSAASIALDHPPPEATLQINLCAGDVDYAHQTVPALVSAHPYVAERLAIVDCSRPQRTRIFDPEMRLPVKKFSGRLEKIRAIVRTFKEQGLFDRVEFLEPGDDRFPVLARRYVRPWMTETHDYGGCAFMPYWAAWEFPRHRFVIHYDADMLLHVTPGHDWTTEAQSRIEELPAVIAAAPRTSPPGFARIPEEDAPTLHEGRPFVRVPGGWLNDWFSTRCLLIDRERLEPHLPLIGKWTGAQYALRRLGDRGYPPGPEHLLHRRLGSHGLRCFHLANTKAWLLHPPQKSPEFLSLLPEIMTAVARGTVPREQTGYADIRLEAWSKFLNGSGA